MSNLSRRSVFTAFLSVIVGRRFCVLPKLAEGGFVTSKERMVIGERCCSGVPVPFTFSIDCASKNSDHTVITQYVFRGGLIQAIHQEVRKP